MQSKDWLNQFLTDDRQKHKLNGRPLYRYRMSDAEFSSLKASLKTSVWLDIANVTKNSGWNAAFVIYAAEWWRREYDGGKWSWENVFSSLDTTKPKSHYLIVELGLAYWQRKVRVINGQSRYLGTIATEGGLPLNQLNRADNWLSRLFKHAIPKYLRLQGNDLSTAVVIIRDYADTIHLPQNYRNDQTYAVLGDMVCLVAKLKKDHQLSDKNDPIGYLDNINPDWRETFPLPIDNQAGLALLTDMIKTAVEKTETSIPFRGRRLLTNDGTVQLLFEFAATVALEKITRSDGFPFRVDVDIVSDTGKIYPIGVAYQQSDKAQLKMPRCALKRLKDEEVSQGYTLQFKHFSDVKAVVPLIEAIDDSVPWTFIADNDEWLLVGTASVRTRAKQVRILYEPSLTCSAEVTTLPSPSNKKLIETSGVIELRDAENCFRIQTAQAESARRYYLSDKNRFNFSSIPKTVYVGLPELYCFDSETERSEKINKPLFARPAGSKTAWQQLTTAQQGVYELRLEDEQHNTLFRTRCVLLPEHFQVTVLATKQRVVIEQCGHASLSCALAHRIDTVENDVICEFNAETPPSFVDLTLDWQGMSESLTFSVPYPMRGGLLMNANSDKLKNVSVDDLYGVRLRLVGENHHHERSITLEFKLKDDLLDTHDLYFCDVVKQKGAVIELSLIKYQQQIKKLLAISHHADSFVRLTVDELSVEIFRVDILRSVLISENRLRKIHFIHSITDIKNVDDALNIDDDELRLLFIRHRLKQLCCDFAHADWRYLNEQQNDQPLVENELWTAAILDNRVLVALVLKLDSDFMQRFVDELPVMWELIPITDWLVVFSRYKNYYLSIIQVIDDENEAKNFVSHKLNEGLNKVSVLSQSLETVVQLLKYHLFDGIDSSTQTDNALQWLISTLKEEQQALINRQDGSKWLKFLKYELNQQRQVLQPTPLKPLLDKLCYYRDNSEIDHWRLPVVLTPLILAHCCLTSIPVIWQADNTLLFKLRQLKAFDEPWFNTAFTWTLAYLSQQPDYQQRLQQETANMINSDENDLIPEIDDLIKLVEQEINSAVQEAQGIKTQVPVSFKNNGELRKLRSEHDDLKKDHEQLTNDFKTLETKHNNLVTNIKTALDKRDNAIRNLLAQVKVLHQALQDIRGQLDND